MPGILEPLGYHPHGRPADPVYATTVILARSGSTLERPNDVHQALAALLKWMKCLAV